MSNTPSVYVFNATRKKIGLILNDYGLDSMAGTASSNSYVPNVQSVPRNPSGGNPGLGQFGGTNKLSVNFPNGGGVAQHYEVDINSDTYPMTDDLQLYIFFSEAILVSISSQTNEGQSTVLKGTPLTAAQSEAMNQVQPGGRVSADEGS